MLKKFLFILLILLMSGLNFAGEIIINYSFDTPKIQNGLMYLKGCKPLSMPFAPKTLAKTINVILPLDETAVSYSVLHDEPITLEGEYYVNDFKPGGRNNVAPPANYYTRHVNLYSLDKYYPETIKSSKFSTHFNHGIPIFCARIYPVQYNPVSGKVRLLKNITVKIKTEKTRANSKLFYDPFVKSMLEKRVDNPQILSTIPYTQRPEDAYDYLIVTLKILEDKFNEFVEFNKRRGLKSKVVNIEDVLLNSSGSDNAEKLKNFIKNEYNERTIRFILLGGDEEYGNPRFIPHRGYDADFNDYGTDYIRDRDIAADMYYETLDGDELDDLEWEVYAARFAVDDDTELQRMIHKTMMYSEHPVKSSVLNNILAGEHLWENVSGGECWGKGNMELFLDEQDLHYETTGFPSDEWNSSKLYDKDATWTASTLINTIHNNKIAWIDHLGHSAVHFIMKLGCKISPHAHNLFEDTFENDGVNANFFIFYTQGCYPLSFDNRQISMNASVNTGHYSDANDCICEFMTAEMDGGAVAIIANTRFGLGDDGHASPDGLDGSSERLQRYFHDAIFGKQIHHLAAMVAYSKEMSKDYILDIDNENKPYYGQMQYVAYEVNALGDPALSIWTKTPAELNPNIQPITSKIYTLENLGPFASVALIDANGTIIASGCGDKDGKVVIDHEGLEKYVVNNPNGKLKIAIKAHNYLPYEGDVDINSTGITNTLTGKFTITNNLAQKNKSALISYFLPTQSNVNMVLYNTRGMKIKTIVNSMLSAGHHTVILDCSDITSGVYYCNLNFSNHQQVKKMIITK